jgi:hypothetical protein
MLVLLAALPFAAGGQGTPPPGENIGVEVSHNLISSQLSLEVSGVQPAASYVDAGGKLVDAAPNWQVLAAGGRRVVSGKFEFG